MLQLYNKNHVKVEGLTKYKDLNIESTLSTGDKVLSFSYPTIYSNNIQEEGYIRTKTAEFVIKSVEGKTDWKAIKANLNVEDLEGKAWDRFDSTEQTITDCLNLALAGTGWSVGTCNVTKKRTVRKTACSVWDIIQEAISTYRIEIEFDSLNKKINIYDKIGSDKGAYFVDNLNLKELTVQGNSYTYYTRIQAVGKDDLTLAAPGYVENYQYSNKIKTLYWKDERYTDVESLTEDAILKLDEISKPYRAYSADILDLVNNSDKYKNILDYSLGDTITLISKNLKVKEKQRIAKITEYPDEPERNTCELSNIILSFENIQKENQDTTDTVNNITEDNGTISQAAISTAVNNLTAQQFSAATARIGTLEATTAHITNGVIDNATIDVAKVNNLSSTYATIQNLSAATANISTLQTDVASIKTVLAGNVGASNLQAGAIQAGSAVIANSAISSAQIISLDVGKINAGTISTTKFTLQSDSGNMLMSDNTFQIKDANRVRVQIGKDASNDYNMYVWDASGNLMFDATGLKADGIKQKIIRDDMVSDTANIDGKKININSLYTEMNGSTSTLKASKIMLDTQAQTLDVAFTSLSQTVTTQGQTVSSQGTQITTIQGQISNKIWETDITTAIDNTKIGIRNLLRNTDFKTDTSNWDAWGTQSISIDTNNKYDNCNSLKIVATGAGNGSYGVVSSNLTGSGIVNNQNYTVSFYAKGASGGESLHVELWGSNNTKDITLTTTWTKYTANPIGSTNSQGFYFWLNASGTVYITEIMIVEGNKAPSNWICAPEDTDAQITTINSNYSSLNQTVNGISANVSSLQTTTSNLGTRMSAAESSITQNANNISLKVSSSDYNGNTIASLINQSATTVTIQASKIDLTGYVTVTSLSTAGATTINGANITTGTIDAHLVNVTNINANNINAGKLNANLLFFAGSNVAMFKCNPVYQNTYTPVLYQDNMLINISTTEDSISAELDFSYSVPLGFYYDWGHYIPAILITAGYYNVIPSLYGIYMQDAYSGNWSWQYPWTSGLTGYVTKIKIVLVPRNTANFDTTMGVRVSVLIAGLQTD